MNSTLDVKRALPCPSLDRRAGVGTQRPTMSIWETLARSTKETLGGPGQQWRAKASAPPADVGLGPQ
eukprot:8372389-Lingulodinium_polyedra.AAC.1